MRIAIVTLALGGLVFAQGAAQAKSLLGKGEFQRAADAAAKVTEKDPANLEAWLVLADAQVGLNEPKEAWTTLEEAMEHHPKAVALKMKLGDVFVRIGNDEQAAQSDSTTITNFFMDATRMYDEALALEPNNADAFYGKALAQFSIGGVVVGAMDKAKEFVAKALELNPELGRAHALRAFMFYTERKYVDAQGNYEIALKFDDSDPLVFVRLGHSFYAQGKYDEAKQTYLRGLKRHPDNDIPIRSGLYNVAKVTRVDVTSLLKEATETAPKSFHAWYHYGYALLQANRHKEAHAALKKALAIRPGDAQVLYYMGYAVEAQNDGKGALAHYRKALKANPDHAEAATRFQGLILTQADNITDQEQLFEELIKLAPNNGWIHNNYALVLRNWSEPRGGRGPNPPAPARKRLKRSGEVYEIAARLLPNEAQIQSDTGLLFEFYPCNRDDQKARDYFCRSLEISDYAYRDAFDGLTRLCMRIGDWETLKDYAEGVIGTIERGNQAIAPVGGSPPRKLPNETPGLLARAKRAYAVAEGKLKGS